MSEITRKQKEVKRAIEVDHNVVVSNKWFKKYMYMYSKFTPLGKKTLGQALDTILENPSSFAYFIYGCRANYVANKEKIKNNN